MSTGLANPTNGRVNGSRPVPGGPRVLAVDPRLHAIASGGPAPSYGWQALARVPSFDEVARAWGPTLYDRMLTDPAVHSGFETLKKATVGSGIQLAAAMAVDITEAEPTPEQEADAERASEIRDFCQWTLERLRRPINDWLYEMLDAAVRGVKLSEIVWDRVTDPTGRSALVPVDLVVKPQDAWQFWVDPFMQVVGVEANAVTAGSDGTFGVATPTILSPEKFCWLTWWPKDGDPRGRSILRAAYLPWLDKQQVMPDRFNLLFRFGMPRIVAVEGENTVMVQSEDGTEVAAGPLNHAALEGLAAGSFARLIGVTGFYVIPATGNVNAHNEAIRDDDRQILLAILQNTRTIMEAEFGSKADSQTGKDVTDLVVQYAQRSLGSMLEDRVLWETVRVNFGQADADRFTPDVVFPMPAQEDRAKTVEAFARWSRNYPCTEAQLRWADEQIGAPPAPWGARPGGTLTGSKGTVGLRDATDDQQKAGGADQGADDEAENEDQDEDAQDERGAA